MPELPELEVLRENLNQLIGGKRIEDFRIIKPYIQKTLLPDDLVGQKSPVSNAGASTSR